MGKTNENLEGASTMKATVPNMISHAIDTICKNTGRVQADLIRDAVEQYIKQRYPELLLKSDLEVMNDVKYKYAFDKTYQKYSKEQILKDNIPIMENALISIDTELKDTIKKIDDVEGKIRTLGTSKPNEKAELQKELENLERKKSQLEQGKSYYENSLQLAKEGKTFGAGI